MSRNAYIVSLLSKAKPPRRKGGNLLAARQSFAEAMTSLGAIATTLRDIAQEGLTPDQDADFAQTLQAIRQACAAIMEALGHPGRPS